MPAEGLQPDKLPLGTDAYMNDACLVARMRLALALAVLLAITLDPQGLPGLEASRWPVFLAYGLYSMAVDMAAQARWRGSQSRWLHRADLLWYSLMVALTGGVHSLVFLFFFLPILTASFRWGRVEGLKVTAAAVACFVLAACLAMPQPEWGRLLLRASFLLGLGHLCVHWGQAQVRLQQRLTLLREVSQLSNPRFGVERTLVHVLERTRDFHGASQCALVLRDAQTGHAWLRSLPAQRRGPSGQALPLDGDLALALLGPPGREAVLHAPSRWRRSVRTLWLLSPSHCQAADAAGQARAQAVAQHLEVSCFMSVPVALRQGQGRLYLGCDRGGLDRGDLQFLSQLVAQAFPVIDHIDLLDRMASEAALRERQKFALDLHDTAIQPYLGLRLALGALRHKVGGDHGLSAELEKLEAMALQSAQDLRHYARRVRAVDRSESALLAQLRQQAGQVRDFYGVDIAVRVEGELPVNDRLSAEVLQMVREGLANICKHTLAERGEVRLHCQGAWLGICIANEDRSGGAAPRFTPSSISERAAALGGHAHVQHEESGRTAVHIHIPV